MSVLLWVFRLVAFHPLVFATVRWVLHLYEFCRGAGLMSNMRFPADQQLSLGRRNLSDTWREDFSQRLGSACARECAADREHDPNAVHGTRPRHENIRQ